MAKKNAPLKKPPGTDSSGNIRVPGGPMVLDLGEFDDLFGPMDEGSPKQGPLGQFYSGLKDSFSDRFKTKNIVRNFLRSAAPDGISNVMGFADEALKASVEIKESLERTNAADLQYIAKKAQGLLPQVKDYLSNDNYNNISKGLEDKIDEYDYTIQSQRDQTAIRRASAEKAGDNQIKEALDNIALTEQLNHNRSEHATKERYMHERAENSIRDVLKTKRFDFLARSMGMAVDNLQKIAGYNEQINYGFQRKGLELQFRSFLGIKELVKLQEAQLELNARAFNAIIRNTALPDQEKSNNKSLMHMGNETNNRGFVSKTVQALGGKTLSNFLGGYAGETQSRITKSLSQKLAMATMGMKMGEQGSNLWDQKWSMAGNLAGDYLSDFVLNDLVPMAGREARPHITKFSDKYAGGKHNQAGYLMDNIPSFMQDFVNNGQNQHGFKGVLRDLVAPLVPQFGLQDKLQNGTFQTIDQQAVFNQATQRTIVDAIPGYLARILQEIRMTRTGDSSVAREVFDMTTGKFTIEANAHDNLQDRIIPKSAIKSASTTINDTLNTMDENGELSPEARKALGERMLRDASTNKRFDPDEYIRSRGYEDGTDPTVTKELDKFFRGKFEYDERGKMADTSDNHKLRQEFSKAFLDIRSISRDPVKEINRLIMSGHTEPLRAMGIIITKDGHDHINYPRIWEVLRSGVTDGNPFSPDGGGQDIDDPYRDDNTGTKGHRDFMGPAYPGVGAAFAKNKLSRFRSKYSTEEQDLRDQAAKQLKTVRARFGSAASAVKDAVKGTPENEPDVDYKPGIRGFTQMMNGGPASGTPGAPGASYAGFVGDMVSARESTKGYVAAGMEKLTDLYSTFDPTQPVIKGIDFGMGDLIDVNTKKIIARPQDITGEVINRLGQTVVSATEAAAGLMSPKGAVVVRAPEKTADVISKALGLHQNTNTTNPEVEGAQDPNSPDQLNSQDWALGPNDKPVITARGLANEEYVDDQGNTINSLADVASDIYDRTGNLVMTAKEFAGGLWSKRTGKRYRPTKGFSRLLRLAKAGSKFSSMSAGGIMVGALKFSAKAALGLATAAFDFMIDNQNAYLPGEPIPVITRRAVKNGEYYDDKGREVDNFTNVYSPLYNAQGEMVIAPELYKQLTNFDGTKHVLAKNKGIWAKFVMRPIRAMKNAYIARSKRYYKWLGKKALGLGSWVGKKTLGGFAKTGGKLFNSMFESIEDPNTRATVEATVTTGQQQTTVLEELLLAVRDLKPKELRKGSWQDKAKRDAIEDVAEANEEKEEKKNGLLKRGLAGIAGMIGLGKKKGDGEEEEDGFGLDDAADVASIGDSIRGNGNGGPGGGGGPGESKWKRFKKWTGKMAGKLAATSVGTIGINLISRAAMLAATGVSAVLTAPVMAGAAVIGGAYLGAKRYSEITGEFRELRFEQYGVGEPVSKGFVDSIASMSMFSLGGDKKKVMALESLIEKHTDRSSPTPAFRIDAAGVKPILEAMGIDFEDPAAVTVFARWLEKRFKPIYLKWVGGLATLGKSDISINEIDQKLPNELKADYLEAIAFPYSGDTPYASLDNPFSVDYPLVDNVGKIEEMFKDLIKKYAKDRKKDDKEVAKVDSNGKPVDSATAAAGVAGTAAVGANKAKDIVDKQAESKAKAASVMKSPIAVAAMTSSSLSGTVAALHERIGNALTALQSIRMRAYGLQTLHLSDVRALLSLEAAYAKDLTITDGSVDYNGDESHLLAKAGNLFGKSTATGSADRPKLYNWLTERFAPSFRAYYGTAMAFNATADLKTLESGMKGADKVSVAQAILGANYRHDKTVWECDSIFEIKGPLGDLKKLADLDLKHLQKESEKEVVDSPTQKGSDQQGAKTAADSGGSFTDRMVGKIKDTWNTTKETVSGAWNRASDAVGDVAAGAKIAVGMGPDYGEGGAKGGTVQSAGTTGSVTKGNGGKWESIPYPESDGSIKGAYPTLKAVAEMTGVPVDWLLVIAGIESGFRYTVKAKTSSAEGWFQFINSTWDEMYKAYGPEFGCPPDPKRSRAERKDPRINALMGAMFIKRNYNGLKKALGRDNLTDTDLYMAHFLGLGGAVKFFKADPNAMAYKVFKKEYSANMPLFFVNGKPSQPRTIAQFYQLFQKKIETFWNGVGKSYRTGNASVETPAEVAPQAPGDVDKAAEAQASANLKEDAGSKEGVAGEAEAGAKPSGDAPITPGTGGPSVMAMARDTAPMPGAPATGGGNSTSVSATGTDSGAATAETQQQTQLDAAQSQNARRQAEISRDQQAASSVNDIQTKQLNTLFEIRDLTRLQVDNSNDLLKALNKNAAPNSTGSGNNMNPSTTRTRPATDRPSDLTLR